MCIGDEEDNRQANTAPDSITNNRATENSDSGQLGTTGKIKCNCKVYLQWLQYGGNLKSQQNLLLNR